MITKSTAVSALIALLSLFTAVSDLSAQDRDGAERFFGYMDRNKDGRLDAEEVRRMPGSFREQFEKAEINISNGISKEQFTREMPRIMEQMRQRRDEERSRGDDRGRSDSRRDEQRRPEEPKKGSSYIYQQPKREPVTMKIPRNFEDGDTDKDGQIGLYEWRSWRPLEKYHFRVYDINGDGFLTPKELSIPPTEDELRNYLTSIGVNYEPRSNGGRSSRSRDSGSRGPSSAPDYAGNTGSGAPPQPAVVVTEVKPSEAAAEDDRVAKIALIFFKGMDVDKNGTITSEEWARSEKLKPKFEQAGYDLSQPMNQQQFIEAYRASEEKS